MHSLNTCMQTSRFEQKGKKGRKKKEKGLTLDHPVGQMHILAQHLGVKFTYKVSQKSGSVGIAP